MKDDATPPCSALYLPASNPRAIAKARTLPVDAMILDLEDAVAPEAKAEARAAAVAAFAEGDWGERLRVLRINALDTEWGVADLAAARSARVDAVLAPKVTGPADIARYDAALEASPARLWVMIETCAAAGRLQAIADCAAGGRLAGFVIGTNDLALEMRATLDEARSAVLPILTLAVAAARSAGLVVLDGVCNDFATLDRFAREAAQARMLGFDGKTLIHPAQIAACHAAFAPSEMEVARARAIVAAFDLPENAARGAISLDGEMVERLHLAGARRVLARADRVG